MFLLFPFCYFLSLFFFFFFPLFAIIPFLQQFLFMNLFSQPQETERWWQRKVEGFEERRRQRSRWTRQKRVRRQRLHVRHVGAHVETNAFEVDECVRGGGALFREWMRRHVEHRVECAGDRVSACARRKVARFVLESTHVRQCGSVPEKSGGRTPTVHRCPHEEAVGGHFTSLRATVPQDTNMQRA